MLAESQNCVMPAKFQVLQSLLDTTVYKIYGNSCLMVCESASITKYMNPAISVFVESTSYATEENKLDCLFRSTIILKEKSIEISLPQLFIDTQNNNWLLKVPLNVICCG